MKTPDSIAVFSFNALEFDTQGDALYPLQLESLLTRCNRAGVTDLIFLAHGFRCDASAATELFANLLTTLGENLGRDEFAPTLADRTFAVAGVYWPSQEFRESFGTAETLRHALHGLRRHCPTPDHVVALDRAARLLDAVEVNRNAQDRFVASVLLAFADGRDDPDEGLPLLHEWLCSQQRGSELLDLLRPGSGVSQHVPEHEGGIENIRFAAPLLGGIGTFLNFMSWSAMKKLSGAVGTKGLADSVTVCRRQLGSIRIHLVGHSLGGRLVTACCKALAEKRATPVDSLSLLEAAFSHHGFSPDAGSGKPGFFRDVVGSRIVAGPIISTLSKNDDVLRIAYAVASRLCRDRLQGIGDSFDPYGGIGHNGARRTPESTVTALRRAGEAYRFQPGIVSCLDGSSVDGEPGLITGHGDVTNPHVTYAIASAVCRAA